MNCFSFFSLSFYLETINPFILHYRILGGGTLVWLKRKQSLESVLQNINKLNRSLEGVIAVGNEFSSVEALWSQFENVMASNAGSGEGGGEEEAAESDRGERKK